MFDVWGVGLGFLCVCLEHFNVLLVGLQKYTVSDEISWVPRNRKHLDVEQNMCKELMNPKTVIYLLVSQKIEHKSPFHWNFYRISWYIHISYKCHMYPVGAQFTELLLSCVQITEIGGLFVWPTRAHESWTSKSWRLIYWCVPSCWPSRRSCCRLIHTWRDPYYIVHVQTVRRRCLGKSSLRWVGGDR